MPGMAAHACNLSTLGAQGRSITQGQEYETSLGNIARPHLYKKFKRKKNISQVWWYIPLALASQEAGAGDSLEPWSLRLQ